jgi:hypothetical protein
VGDEVHGAGAEAERGTAERPGESQGARVLVQLLDAGEHPVTSEVGGALSLHVGNNLLAAVDQ